MDYYERPVFLKESNYESKESYLSSVYGGTIQFVCDYCGEKVEHNDYKKSDHYTCIHCGALLK